MFNPRRNSRDHDVEMEAGESRYRTEDQQDNQTEFLSSQAAILDIDPLSIYVPTRVSSCCGLSSKWEMQLREIDETNPHYFKLQLEALLLELEQGAEDLVSQFQEESQPIFYSNLVTAFAIPFLLALQIFLHRLHEETFGSATHIGIEFAISFVSIVNSFLTAILARKNGKTLRMIRETESNQDFVRSLLKSHREPNFLSLNHELRISIDPRITLPEHITIPVRMMTLFGPRYKNIVEKVGPDIRAQYLRLENIKATFTRKTEAQSSNVFYAGLVFSILGSLLGIIAVAVARARINHREDPEFSTQHLLIDFLAVLLYITSFFVLGILNREQFNKMTTRETAKRSQAVLRPFLSVGSTRDSAQDRSQTRESQPRESIEIQLHNRSRRQNQ